MTHQQDVDIIWSREGKLLSAPWDGKGYSMQPGFFASLFNPIDLLSGAVVGKLFAGPATGLTRAATSGLESEGSGVVAGLGTEAAGALKGALVEGAEATTKSVASDVLQRVNLVNRMQGIVTESAQVGREAILRGDRLVLSEFLTPKEVARALGGGNVSRCLGTFVEWRSRLWFAKIPAGFGINDIAAVVSTRVLV